MKFRLISQNKPAGDQPKAIKQLVAGLRRGAEDQTLLGVTGSGKTFTIANVIAEMELPTLVIAHNKTLAAQLCNEFRELFPENAVHYFVSYYDYYQPEAYLPTTDTYIAKEAMINEEIDRLRHAATSSLLTRKDVIIVASVSCIYGLGAPEAYSKNILRFRVGDEINRAELAKKLVQIQFQRTTSDLKRGTFRLRGDHWEIMPANEEIIYHLRVDGNKIAELYALDPVVGFEKNNIPQVDEAIVSPARHFITLGSEKERALKAIEKELAERLRYFAERRNYLEAERLERRTRADITMLREVGYCNGIENYARHLSGRKSGEPPATLLDYFPADFLLVIDESHMTIPQLGGMYEGDASRKKTLIEYGFRLPSAADNRPLTFPEFEARMTRTIYTSATPGAYEQRVSAEIIEQVIRPTGLVDPQLTILPARGQVENLIPRLRERITAGERALVTTLTKRMAEDLAEYLEKLKIKASYLHSEVKTLERIRILTRLRKGSEKGGFDVIVGVNLLREGLDLPEVSLIAILDADKEGFLRSETALIQIIGRAARNINGEVLIYADRITSSISRAVKETERRRKLQLKYNEEHRITPRTIIKKISDILPQIEKTLELELTPLSGSRAEIEKFISTKRAEMYQAAKHLDFELAAVLRDEIRIWESKLSKGKRATKIK